MQPRSGDNTHQLADVLEHNILTLQRLQEQATARRSLQDRIADAITTFSGSMSFVYIHIAWFGAWIVVNSGMIRLPVFDAFPYGLLTMLVSLEAIFLSTFVLLSQNRQASEAQQRADLALQIGLLTEHELTRVLQMLDVIQARLGIEDDRDIELAQLELETRPEDVLAEIKRVQKSVHHRRDVPTMIPSGSVDAQDVNGANSNN